MASGRAAGTVRLWDPDTGIRVLQLDASTRRIDKVQFSADGSRLLVVDDADIARVMALDIDDLISIAHARLTRSFTEAECRHFLHLEQCADGTSV